VPYVVRPMRLEDIDDVGFVERECFSTPWPSYAYRREIRDNRLSRYAVLVWRDDPASAGPSATHPRFDDEAHFAGVRRALSQVLRPFGVANPPPHAPSAEELIGFVGLWLVLDEGHITTICISQRFRGRGLGEVLLSHIMGEAQALGARRVTLEVRVTNEVAQALYKKYGFAIEGIRRRYYSDNNEDAYIMWSDALAKPEYAQRLAELRAAVLARVGDISFEPAVEGV
jgi:[ribosomal protein S18]-alanine N-acetyltransferase